MTRIAYVLAISLCVAAEPAMATTFYPQTFTCPVGGEKFKANVVASYSTWGRAPDGRPYGTLPVHPIVECPKNGLLLVEEKFSAEDLVILEVVVNSPEYQALRTTETPHFRAWWLLTKLQRDPYRLAWEQLQSTWETDENWERKVRYQAAFIAAATSLKRDEEHAGAWLAYNLRAANALRELGHFDKALALLSRIDKPEYLPPESEDAQLVKDLISGLRTLTLEANPVSEPANLIPDSNAAMRCEWATPPLSAVELTACAKPELKRLRDEARKQIDTASKRGKKE
jgi:hypothetical protein